MEIKFERDQIMREILARPAGIYEIRILMNDFYNTKLSMYFDSEDPDKAVNQMIRWNYPKGCCINWYMTINPVKEHCYCREQWNRLMKTRTMTQDDDIARLRWLALDIDAEHPAGVSATDEEKAAAREQAREVYSFLDSVGFRDPEVVDSGNGYHLKYPLDLPNDNESVSFIGMVVDKLHRQFPFVDTAVKNPSRILKLPGTIAMKGRDIREADPRFPDAGIRPHRMARILRDAGPGKGWSFNECE